MVVCGQLLRLDLVEEWRLFCLYFVVFWVWREKDNFRTMGVVLGILSTFHTGLTAAMAMSVVAGADAVVPLVAHGILAALFWLLFFNRQKWCTS